MQYKERLSRVHVVAEGQGRGTTGEQASSNSNIDNDSSSSSSNNTGGGGGDGGRGSGGTSLTAFQSSNVGRSKKRGRDTSRAISIVEVD